MDRNGKKPEIIYCDTCECWHSPGSIYCSGGNTEDTE